MKSPWFTRIAIFALTSIILASTLPAQDDKAKAKPKKPAEDIVVSGEIINADLKDKVTNSPCKTFTFKMEKDKGYQIQLTSQAFPPYLRLENSGGQISAAGAARFDPVGGQSAFLVHRPAKTEDFEIVVTDEAGRYNIVDLRPGTFATLTVTGATGPDLEAS